MPLPIPALPFGMRDAKVTPLGADGSTPGTAVDLPIARHLNWAEAEDSNELRGDDKVVAVHGSGATVEWELESGGIPMEALAAMTGGVVTTTGTTPAIVKRFKKKVTDQRPYFKIEGQAISDSGGDVHSLIYKAKVTENIEGNFEDNEFFVTTAGGKGYPSTETGQIDVLYDFIHNETITAIT